MADVTDNRRRAERVSSHFGRGWLSRYVYWKIRSDPVYEVVATRVEVSRRPLLDVGCGVGILPFYLRESGISVPVIGLDLDSEKIERARRVSREGGYDVEFQKELVAELDEIPGDVALLDVVHYLEDDPQETLMKSIAAKLEPGARLIMRETLADGSWRAGVTWLEEALARATGWMRTTTINFPAMSEIDACFPSSRFDRTVSPLWGRTPFNSYLIEYVKRQ